jgi:hypothetical protein
MGTLTHSRRATPRARIALYVTLARGRAGADIAARTYDVGPAGMRVKTRRPLGVDEQLAFVLALADGTRVTGRAHVVREEPRDVYGLRFDRLGAGDRERLAALVG